MFRRTSIDCLCIKDNLANIGLVFYAAFDSSTETHSGSEPTEHSYTDRGLAVRVDI